MRQGSLRYAAENTAVFCLDPQILACPSDWRLETASRAVSAGKEVRADGSLYHYSGL